MIRSRLGRDSGRSKDHTRTDSATGGRWGRVSRLCRPPAVVAPKLGPVNWLRVVAILLALVALASFVVGGLMRSRVQTGIDSFLPADDPSVTELSKVGSRFGGDPIVVLLRSEQPRQFFSEQQLLKLLHLEGTLYRLPGVGAVYGPATLLNQIFGQVQDNVIEMIGGRDGLADQAFTEARNAGKSDADAQAAKQAALDRFAIRYGPMMVQHMSAGLPTMHNPGFVAQVVFQGDAPRPMWKFVVPSNDTVAILVRPIQDADGATISRLVDGVRAAVRDSGLPTAGVTVSGVPTVVAALAAEAKREGPLLGGVALLAVALCFWLVPWTRRSRRLVPLGTTIVAISITLAIFGWLHRPLSIGVVAFLSVVLGIGCYYPTYFAVRARVRTVLTVAAATAASLATLVLSPLPLVRDLGLTLSIGVLLSALLGALARRLVYRGDPADDAEHLEEATDSGAIPWRELTGRRAPLAVFLAALVIAALGWGLLPKIPLQTDIEQFAAGLPALDDAKHVEDVIGSSGELDVVLTGVNVTSPAALAWMNKAETVIITQFGDRAHRVISMPLLLSYLGDNPTRGQIDSAMRFMPLYLTSAVLYLDRGMSVMLYGVKIDDLAGIQQLRDGLLEQLPPTPPQYHVQLAGLPIVAARGQQLVSEDRLAANLLGMLAAGLVLAIGLRRRWDALRAVLAAALATGVGLFLLWLTGTPLSPITVALGSLTAAVGCEFTVLLSEATRRRNPALRRAVLLVTATSVVGYVVLVISGIAVVREFGMLLAGAVLLALLSSLCVVRLTAGPMLEQDAPGGLDLPTKGPLQEVH
jgi:predicted RND superfamily exporter protein